MLRTFLGFLIYITLAAFGTILAILLYTNIIHLG